MSKLSKVIEGVLHTDVTAIGPWEKFKILEKGEGSGAYTIQTVDGEIVFNNILEASSLPSSINSIRTES